MSGTEDERRRGYKEFSEGLKELSQSSRRIELIVARHDDKMQDFSAQLKSHDERAVETGKLISAMHQQQETMVRNQGDFREDIKQIRTDMGFVAERVARVEETVSSSSAKNIRQDDRLLYLESDVSSMKGRVENMQVESYAENKADEKMSFQMVKFIFYSFIVISAITALLTSNEIREFAANMFVAWTGGKNG